MQYQYTPSKNAQAILDYFGPTSSAEVSAICDQAILATFGDKKTLEEKILELDTKSAALKAVLG